MTANPFDSQQWLEFVNNNSAQVPVYGIVRVTGVQIVEPGRVVLTVDQPNTYGCQANCFVNGPVPVNDGAYGYCTRSGTIVGLYDSSDGTPVYGDAWGPRSGSWKLRKNTGGFFCLGPTNTGQSLALFAPLPMRTFLGKTVSKISKGTTGTVNIYTGSLGSETDSGVTMTGVLSRWGDAQAGAIVRCVLAEETAGAAASWEVAWSDTC